MNRVTTVTQKGQATIPKEIRDALGLKPYDKVRFSLEHGHVRLEKAYPSLDEVAGSLPANKLGVSVEEAIEIAREEYARERGEHMKSL